MATFSGGFVDASQILTGSLPLTKLASGTSAQIIVCDASGVPTYVTSSGDVTTSNAGVWAIGSNVIVNADVSTTASIALTKLASANNDLIIGSSGSGSGWSQTSSTGDVTVTITGSNPASASWAIGQAKVSSLKLAASSRANDIWGIYTSAAGAL